MNESLLIKLRFALLQTKVHYQQNGNVLWNNQIRSHFIPLIYSPTCLDSLLSKKQFLYRSVQTQSVPESWGSQSSRQSTNEGDKVVSHTYPPLYPRKYSWYSFLFHCPTSRKVAGSIPDGDIVIFHWHNLSGHTMTLGLTKPLTEMSTRNISWG